MNPNNTEYAGIVETLCSFLQPKVSSDGSVIPSYVFHLIESKYFEEKPVQQTEDLPVKENKKHPLFEENSESKIVKRQRTDENHDKLSSMDSLKKTSSDSSNDSIYRVKRLEGNTTSFTPEQWKDPGIRAQCHEKQILTHWKHASLPGSSEIWTLDANYLHFFTFFIQKNIKDHQLPVWIYFKQYEFMNNDIDIYVHLLQDMINMTKGPLFALKTDLTKPLLPYNYTLHVFGCSHDQSTSLQREINHNDDDEIMYNFTIMYLFHWYHYLMIYYEKECSFLINKLHSLFLSKEILLFTHLYDLPNIHMFQQIAQRLKQSLCDNMNMKTFLPIESFTLSKY